VEVGEIAEWLWSVNLRDFPIYDLFSKEVIVKNLDYFSNTSQKIFNSLLKSTDVIEIMDTVRLATAHSQPTTP
jgi:hypothetical protein